MRYKYETERESYALFSSGAVLHGYPGHAAFPARLASEVFRRCAARLAAEDVEGPYTIYDPCCGTAIHLATVAFLNWDLSNTIIASDIDRKALAFAGKNLSLLTVRGMERRIAQIAAMIGDYDKESHRRALAGAQQLRDRLVRYTQRRQVRTHLFGADATLTLPLRKKVPARGIDIVFADVPYGRRSTWRVSGDLTAAGDDAVRRMLSVLYELLPEHAMVAIATSNRQKVDHERYERLKQLRSGKRRMTLLSPRG